MEKQKNLFEEIVEEKKDINKTKSKYPDKKGKIKVGGFVVDYTFKAEYFEGVPHFEFQGEKGNPISETGYRSCFTDCFSVNYYDTFEEALKGCVANILKENKKKCIIEVLEENTPEAKPNEDLTFSKLVENEIKTLKGFF